MDLTSAIEYLLHNPENKSEPRLHMEQEFFTTSGLTYEDEPGEDERKHLILNLDESDVFWSNGLMWLKVIHEHEEISYTMTLNGSGEKLSVTTSDAPEQTLTFLLSRLVKWEMGATYKTNYDDYVAQVGDEVFPRKTFTVAAISVCGTIAYSEEGYGYHISDLHQRLIAKGDH